MIEKDNKHIYTRLVSPKQKIEKLNDNKKEKLKKEIIKDNKKKNA